MPLSAVTLQWNELDPTNTSDVSGGNEAIHSIKSSIRNGLGAEHNWPSASGAGFGYHLFGSARAFYGPQSNVSSGVSDGRLMLTSDTSRLFSLDSAGTVFVGGPTVPLMGSHPGDVPQRHQWVEEVGTAANFASSGSTVVTFPNSGFSGLPYVFLTVIGAPSGEGGTTDLKIVSITTANGAFDNTQMVLAIYNPNGAIYDTGTVFWRSIGTRAT